MSFDLNFATQVMYPAAGAAYSIMNVPPAQLHLPPNYSAVGTIVADPSRAAHQMSLASPDQQRIPNAMVRESNIFGLVAYNAADKAAIVAIRGTETLWDWLGDFDAAPVTWFPNPATGFAHQGFQLVYEHICASLRGILKTACPNLQRLFVTGHSLGGAVATLAAFDILQSQGLGFAPVVYTFAGPRVLAPDFAGNFKIQECYRIVNFMDVVPQVPLPPLYVHVGQETLVHGGFRPLDVTYAHHLTTYLNGLQKLSSDDGPAGPVVTKEIVSVPDTRVGATPVQGNPPPEN